MGDQSDYESDVESDAAEKALDSPIISTKTGGNKSKLA